METESTLSSYHIFNAVAEAGNLSKAAKALYISQPAISRAVSKLEQALSVKLFIRGSRGVRLTEEGKLLYEHTKSAFDSLRQGEENLRRFGTLGLGQLRIGVSTTLCKYILMPYLQRFIQEYPHVQLMVQCHSAQETQELIEKGKLDLGLITAADSHRTLEFLPVTEIEDIFVASESYLKNLKQLGQEPAALAEASLCKNRRSSAKKASDTVLSYFKDGTLMLLDETHTSRLHIEEFLDKNQIETNRVLEFSNMDLLIDFSKIGLGIGCVIKEFVQSELENHTLIELPLPSKPAKRNIGFVYNKTSLQSGSFNKFIDFYKGGTR